MPARSSRLQLLDAERPPGSATPELPAGCHLRRLLWHPARDEVGFSLAGARAFNDVYSIDVASGRLERWTFSEMGGGEPGDAARCRDRHVEELRRS